MRYVVSDLHGEYELFLNLLKIINFSENDEMYICGDIIDKGKSSVRLAKYISERENIHCIIGNHEYAFLKYYEFILRESPDDFDEVLKRLQDYFPDDGYLLDWETVDWFGELPAYIEGEDFICVHAGIPLDEGGALVPLSSVDEEFIVHDRRFKEPSVIHYSPKCVFFGHTQTDCISGECKVLAYARNKDAIPHTVGDYYKIHLDTGSWNNGVLGCFCIDTLKTFYARKSTL